MAKKNMKIKFLTDSAADIPVKLRKEYDIEVLPFSIITDEKEYLDGEDFAPQKFYDFLLSQEKIPTHSQITAYQFCEIYERLWTSGYSSVIYTSINSKASSTYQNSVMARDEFFEDHPEAKDEFEIIIVDSLTYTMAYGYGILRAAELAKNGASANICAATIEDWCRHSRILFTPMDLSFAKKSGRISAAAAFLGDKLGLHPIMTFENGESKVLSKVRGERNVIPTMIKMCQKGIEDDSPYIVINANNKELNKKMSKQFTEALGRKPIMEYYIGGVISINAGPNLVGVIYREK